MTGRALAELGRQLHPLRLAARQRGRGLAEPHVAEPDIDERLHLAGDRRLVREELQRLLGRHVEHFGDVLALPRDVERVAVVARALADLARHVDVGQEVHLDLDGAVALARLAAPALDVEREPAGLVAADLRLLGGGEQRADLVEHARVGGRVRAGRAPDRRLVDVDDLVDVLGALDLLVAARHLAGPVDLLHQRRVQDVVDQRALAAAADAGDRDEAPERDLDVDVLQVVLARAAHREPGVARVAAQLGHLDLALARQVLPGDRRLRLEEVLDRARDDDLAAVLARAGTDVDDVIGDPDRLLVVLDDDHRVAQVAQPHEGLDQALVVALVQADRRLVEDVQHADQPAADLRGEADALRLAAGQRGRVAIQRQVVEARRRAGTAARSMTSLNTRSAIMRSRSLSSTVRKNAAQSRIDSSPTSWMFLLADRDRQRRGPQPRALARRARHEPHVALDDLAHAVGLRLGVAALDPRDHALVLASSRSAGARTGSCTGP